MSPAPRTTNLVSFLFIVALSLGATLRAAESGGTVVGKIVNAATGAPVVGATISVRDTSTTAESDLNGAFRLNAVEPGAQDIVAAKPGFRSITVTDLAVTANGAARVEIPLTPEEPQQLVRMDAFSVSAEALANSDVGLLNVRQKAVAVSDAIGSEQFSRLSLSNAAEAMGKVTGASLLDGKYVVIRGLGDRYTNAQMNGLMLPSADPDKRAVQMDQFPSSLIDSITTVKSFTPDQSGSFSGGSVNIKTKSFPDGFFVHASVSTTFNTNATGEDILTVPGGGTDWLARDDGTRGLSAAVPDPIPPGLTTTAAQLAARQGNFEPARQLDAISKGFHNATFFPRAKAAGLDSGFNFAVGDSLTFRDEQVLGYIAGLTYSRATEHFSGGITGRYAQGSVDASHPRFVDVARVFTPHIDEYNFAELYRAQPNVPGGPPAFGVTRSAEEVEWGAYLRLAWRPTLDHTINATLFHNQSAVDQVKRGIGEATRSDSGGEFRESYDLLYTERGIGSAQISGETNFSSWNDAKLEWRAGFSRSTQDQPDYRSLEFKWSFILQAFDPSGLNNYRHFRALEEDAVEFGADFSRTFSVAGRDLTLKLGGAHHATSRTNRERAFVLQSPSVRTRDGIESFPNPVGLVSQTENSVTFGTVMREISANLNYDGEQTLSAGYAMGDLRWSERWRLVAGARIETTEMRTSARPVAGLTVRPGEIGQSDALPALAVIWSPRPRQNVRFSYGRTLARPTFRELADVVNYEAFTDEFIGGNPDLEMTVIDNLDLRWEWFGRGGDILAASVFHKRLDQPIEEVFSAGRIFPNNVGRGEIHGLELEARRGLGAFSSALADVSVGFNATLIESAVTIPAPELALIRAVFPDASDQRALFGQSPFIFNFDATYRIPRWGSTFTAAYTVGGERLDLVTSGALPDVYEQPAPMLDFIWTQAVSDRWRLKLTAKNLLDAVRETTLEHGGRTYFYERYRQGRKFTLSVTYSFQ